GPTQGDLPRLVEAPPRGHPHARGRRVARVRRAPARGGRVSSAKADILARVRSALGPSPVVPEIPRAYRLAGSLPREGIVDLFCETVAEYRATVHRTDDVAATVQSILAGVDRVGVPAGFPPLGIDV